MSAPLRFDRMELAGSLGDLGTILPLAMAVLGFLLVFAGAQLPLILLDMQTRADLFVPILVLGTTTASNLTAGFVTGIVVAYPLKWERLNI